MGEHLDDNAASEFVMGALSPSALDRAERHLASCRDCRALVATLAVDGGDDSGARTFRREVTSVSQAEQLPRKTLSVGDRVGRYLVLSSLGAGGMGVVFAAYDPNLGRKIALKLLRSGIAGSSKDARNRLRREAQAIAQLSHPNVVSVYDVGTTDDGDLYIAMEFVEGDTLTQWLKKYPRPWPEIIDVFVQAARGLASAHGVGLLHRDFKPDNVLVGGDGRVRVTDFGLARSLLAPDESSRGKPVITSLSVALTVTGTVLGTPRYMPPEQITGDDLDARSDQFSFCVALYEALYGVHPLRNATSVLMLESGDRARPPPEHTKVPAAVARAVLRGLERERARRFPSMGALIAELVPPPRRRPVRYAGLAVASVLVLGGAVATFAQWPPDPVEPEESKEVQLLKDTLQRITRERDELARRAISEREKREELEAELQRKNDEIQRLTEQVAVQILLDLPPDTTTKKPRKAGGTASDAKRVASALIAVQGPMEGCFQEWAERNQGTPEELAEATLIVGLTVTPDGIATLPWIKRSPEHRPEVAGGGAPGMGILEYCALDAMARARFVPGTALDIEATVQWSPGLVTLSSKVVGRRVVPRGKIELQ